MRVYAIGVSGFVGRWLAQELRATGHEMLPAAGSHQIDITDARALLDDMRAARPDAVVHLAAVSYAPDAGADPAAAMQVNVAGTDALFRAIAALDPPPAVLAVSSSEVYGSPTPESLPLTESAPIQPRTIYGLTKVGQEASAVWAALRHELRLVVVRPFNHTGPGQRPVFAVPAFVQRVLALRAGEATSIRAGNIDVRRDIGDVRDVVRAYRLILERTRDGWPASPIILNVGTGRSVPIGEIIETLCRLAGVEPTIDVDPELVRPGEPHEIVGDSTALAEAVGWSPRIPLATTLADMLEDAQQHAAAATQARH